MPGNRKAAEAVIIDAMKSLMPGDTANVLIYQNLFKAMDDGAFDVFMKGLEEGSIRLSIIAPILAKSSLSVERNLKLGKEWGHEFFQQVWMEGQNGAPAYLSTVKYLVVPLPLRRLAQLLVKKISIPEDNRSIDNLTGQPTGKSKGSKISYPEVQILSALNMPDTIIELLKLRGGDLQGFNAMNDSIARTGGVSLRAVQALGTKVKSTQALSTLLLSAHLANTL